MPSLYVNEDWSALVPAGSPEARFGITPADAKRMGLTEAPAPEAKELPKPDDKAIAKPADKAVKKPATK